MTCSSAISQRQITHWLFPILISLILHRLQVRKYVICDLLSPPPVHAAPFDGVADEYTLKPFKVFSKFLHKTLGPHGIPNWLSRLLAFVISEPISHIFNASVSTGMVPSLWKTANVVLLSKFRKPESTENHLRPISLVPTSSKVLESLVGLLILPKIASKLGVWQ